MEHLRPTEIAILFLQYICLGSLKNQANNSPKLFCSRSSVCELKSFPCCCAEVIFNKVPFYLLNLWIHTIKKLCLPSAFVFRHFSRNRNTRCLHFYPSLIFGWLLRDISYQLQWVARYLSAIMIISSPSPLFDSRYHFRITRIEKTFSVIKTCPRDNFSVDTE